jgi:hypothetical protein
MDGHAYIVGAHAGLLVRINLTACTANTLLDQAWLSCALVSLR